MSEAPASCHLEASPCCPSAVGGLHGPNPRVGSGSTVCLWVSPQLSHDANETLPLHLYVKSYDKNVDSKLQGGWGGRWGLGGEQEAGWPR